MTAAGRDSPMPQVSKVTPFAWLFLACCAARIGLLWGGFPFGTLPDLALALGADALILAVLARRLPPQNWLSLALVIYACGAVVERNAALPVAWIGIVLAARELGRWILRPWRQRWNYGFWLIGLAGVISGCVLTAFRLLIHPSDPVLKSLLIHTVASVAILVAATLVIISKRPSAEVLEKDSLAVCVGIGVVLGAAIAARFL